MQAHLFTLIIALSILYVSGLNCNESQKRLKFKFNLVKPYHRSLAEKLHVDNVDTLKSCVEMAKSFKGLAFNYRPNERYSYKGATNPKISRDHYWNQPHLYFNCHVLQCPENIKFKTLISDTHFDYYSLYDRPIAIPNYICIPQVGLFIFHDAPETFQNASSLCHNSTEEHCGTLAHVASESRTRSLKQAIETHNQQRTQLGIKPRIYLAYVGLYSNYTKQSQRSEMFNMEGDNLECFRYRAWEPGHPKISSQFQNFSCVAFTSRGTWLTVDCKKKLPYFCEIFARCEIHFEEL